MILIAYAVRSAPWQGALAISVLAFIAFYVRRFGLRYVGLGMYTLFIYLLATVMAKTENSCIPLASAVVISIPVAFVVNFYFLSEDRRLFLRDNAFLFIDQTGRIGSLLGETFSGRISADQAEDQMHEALKQLQVLLASSERTLAGVATDNMDDRAILEKIFVHEYRIYGAMSMAIDGVMEAVKVEGPVARSLQLEMENAVRLLQVVLQDVKRRTLRDQGWRDQLDQYRGLVEEFYNDLLSGEGIKQKRVFFLMRVLLAMRRVGDSFGALCEDLTRFEEQVQA